MPSTTGVDHVALVNEDLDRSCGFSANVVEAGEIAEINEQPFGTR